MFWVYPFHPASQKNNKFSPSSNFLDHLYTHIRAFSQLYLLVLQIAARTLPQLECLLFKKVSCKDVLLIYTFCPTSQKRVAVGTLGLYFYSLQKIIELTYLEDFHLTFFFNLVVNKLKREKMQKSFYLLAEYSGFIKYSLNKLD